MRLGDLFRRRPSDSRNCAACGAAISASAVFCSSCGVRVDEPEAHQHEEMLKMMAAAVAGTLRDVDTPGVLAHRPPSMLAVLPDTDIAGTAHAANRVLQAVNGALGASARRAALGIVCVHHGQRLRAGAVIEAAGRSLRSGRPELLGR